MTALLIELVDEMVAEGYIDAKNKDKKLSPHGRKQP